MIITDPSVKRITDYSQLTGNEIIPMGKDQVSIPLSINLKTIMNYAFCNGEALNNDCHINMSYNNYFSGMSVMYQGANLTASHNTASSAVAVGPNSAAMSSGVDGNFSLVNTMSNGTLMLQANTALKVTTNSTMPTSSADSSGILGEIRIDDNYVARKCLTGWKRIAWSTF